MSEAVSTAVKGRARGAGRPGPARLLLNNTLAASGLVLLVLIIAAALLAPLLAAARPGRDGTGQQAVAPRSPKGTFLARMHSGATFSRGLSGAHV